MISLGLFALVGQIRPQWSVAYSAWPLAIGGLTVGMGHGAADCHIIRRNQSSIRRLGIYLFWMLVAGLAWWWQSLLALLAFLVLTGVHFGKEEAQFFLKTRRHSDAKIDHSFPGRSFSTWLAIGHGSWVIALPLILHASASWEFLQRVAVVGFAGDRSMEPAFLTGSDIRFILLGIVTAANVFVVWLLPAGDARKWVGRLIVIGAAAWTLHPEFFIGLYLLVWHAPQHCWELKNLSIRGFWFDSALFYIPAVGAVLILAGIAVASGRIETILPATSAATVLVYVIVTPPHHWLAAKLLRHPLDHSPRTELRQSP